MPNIWSCMVEKIGSPVGHQFSKTEVCVQEPVWVFYDDTELTVHLVPIVFLHIRAVKPIGPQNRSAQLSQTTKPTPSTSKTRHCFPWCLLQPRVSARLFWGGLWSLCHGENPSLQATGSNSKVQPADGGVLLSSWTFDEFLLETQKVFSYA